MAEDRLDEQHIVDALERRRQPAGPETREDLRQLGTGLLRRFHTGTFDPILDPLKTLLGVDEKGQFAQCTVDWYLDGRRDSPPFAHRPEMRAAMSRLLNETTDCQPAAHELNTLVNALAGAESDRVLAPAPAKRLVLAQQLVEAYVVGIG